MLKVWERGGVLTPLTLHAAMKADPGLIEVGGQAYLAGLARGRAGDSQCARLCAHPRTTWRCAAS